MDRREACEIIANEVAKYRTRSYDQLRAIVDAQKGSFQITGASGKRYYLDIYVHWDAKPEGNVRVIGCIDDGGWRAFLPLSESFIKAPDSSFVGEA
jgi:hypothetical protein